MDYVVYRRVSTQKQGESGLGMEAQQAAIDRFFCSNPAANIVASFDEVETGTNKRKRPKLMEALELCKSHKATLVVSKLDRLGRNVHFLSGLIESRVDFICLDNPHMSKTMVQLLAVFAEHEADMISKRTKEALAAAKARGVKLGSPQNLTYEVKMKALAAINEKKTKKANEFKRDVLPVVLRKKLEGKTLVKIAEELNEAGYKRPSGMVGGWDATTVRRVML